jgi:hypothetical protein
LETHTEGLTQIEYFTKAIEENTWTYEGGSNTRIGIFSAVDERRQDTFMKIGQLELIETKPRHDTSQEKANALCSWEEFS